MTTPSYNLLQVEPSSEKLEFSPQEDPRSPRPAHPLSLVRTQSIVKCSKCKSDIEHSRIAHVCLSCGAQLSSRPHLWRYM